MLVKYSNAYELHSKGEITMQIRQQQEIPENEKWSQFNEDTRILEITE